MSITPPSDIVLDVLKAASPVKYATAAKRLEKLAQTKLPAGDPFSKALQAATAIARSQPAKTFHVAEAQIKAENNDMLSAARRSGQGSENSALRKAHQKLEGVFLQGMVKSMLSSENSKLYGEGIAGDYWKSFMAEAIANQIAKGKGIGIAESFTRQAGPGKRLNTASVNEVADYKLAFQKLFLDQIKTSASA